MSTSALGSPGHRFWPVGEAAQADYEALRTHVLATGPASNSLMPRGSPAAAYPADRLAEHEPVFDAALLGAHRPPWTPHDDPRLDALADAFALLLNTGRASVSAPTATVIDMIKELPG